MTPALTISSLNVAMSARIFSSGSLPASESLSALTIIMNLIGVLPRRAEARRYINTSNDRPPDRQRNVRKSNLTDRPPRARVGGQNASPVEPQTRIAWPDSGISQEVMRLRKRARRRSPKRPRRLKRRHLHSMLLAGATGLFVPHAGKLPPKPKQSSSPTTVTSASTLMQHAGLGPTGIVTFDTSFRLPPELAYEPLIQEAADRYDLNPALIRAVIQTES